LILSANPQRVVRAKEPSPPFERSAHTDCVEKKTRLLQQAYAAGDYDLVLSLAASIRDTVHFDQQTRQAIDPDQLPAGDRAPVTGLPPAWSAWATGWSHYKALTLVERAGIARAHEPVDVTVGFRAAETSAPFRDVRVARIDGNHGPLVEVRSQVYGEQRRGDLRHIHLVFLADVAAHGTSTYLVFFGNPNAELPRYPSDLAVSGQGYALDISNKYYAAHLSDQMGQLERLTFKRQHRLELYAGGKGHGEPPTIDWGNDYVDEGGFQKLRIRDWSRCPNYEVVRGPLCVRVRRWGFPHSPVHPLFTPSRLHIDQTYTFYAGTRYIIKEGTMRAIQDLRLAAMRDDEWVLSGYSFTDLLWIDRHGKLHQGRVPPAQTDHLWGVGFFHRTSRDAFVALFLQHVADGYDAIKHNGPPTLHYLQHGQLWSRYPAGSGNLKFDRGTTFRQRNAYLVTTYPDQPATEKIETVWKQLRSPLVVQPVTVTPPSDATARGKLARYGETPDAAPRKKAIWDALRTVVDEQLYQIDGNVVDLGYVYDVRERNGIAEIVVTMPHRGRPIYEYIVSQGGGHTTEGIRERVLQVEGIREVVVHPTWNPPWTVARLSEQGRRALGIGRTKSGE